MRKSTLGVAIVSLAAGCGAESRKPPTNAAPAVTSDSPAAAATPPIAKAAPLQASAPVASASATANEGVASLSWSGWSASGGEKPSTACVKESEKELCFDAVDNNCDGQIDEGCPGYHTTGNAMQFTIAWKIPVDLDLHVVGPDGNEVSSAVRDAGSLVFDKACSGLVGAVDDCPEGKVENVYLPADRTVPKGRYKVWVELADRRARKDPQIPCFLGGKIGGKSFLVPFFLANKKGEKRSFELDVQ